LTAVAGRRNVERATMPTTRRGFLRGTVIGTAAATAACAPQQRQVDTGKYPDDPAWQPTGGFIELRTTVNGEARTLSVGPDESTLHMVRERLGLTGCKLGCGHGACGACTMKLDGTPVVTCLLPALKLEGRTLETIEHVGVPQLHPIQRAFMAEDALQCGYCTPGFIVEGAAFVDRHRAEHGNATPSRDEIAAALSGHLCRCGAHAAIYRAVAGACEGKFDSGPEHGPRVDALAKVTGAARYTVDIKPEGTLVAKVLRSLHAHARVRSIDWSEALAAPGVHGAIELTKPGSKVRFVGQEIVALAAVDEATAMAALTKIRVDYEILTGAIGLDAALADGAPEIYDSRKLRKKAPNANESPVLPESWKGNLRGPFELFSHHGGRARRRVEDTKQAGSSGGTVVSAEYETQCQIHTTLEPRAAVAEWIDGKLRLHTTSQALRHMAEDVAERWHLRHEDVEVRAEYVGGGFGAKAVSNIEMAIAIDLARVCGRPVKYVNDRREELTVGGSRPIVRSRIELADDGGEQPAMVFDARSDAGVAIGSAATLMARIHFPQADLALSDYDVINNVAPGCPFRAPGGPPAYFAMEQSVDQLAHTAGVDPLVLRQRWNQNPARKLVHEWAAALPLWRDRPPAHRDSGRFRRGIGLATGTWMYVTEPATRVQIDAGPDGIVVSTASQDMGNGSRTVLADVVADVFGIDPHDLRIVLGSSVGVHGPMSGGSRTANSLAPAASDAALQLRDELVERAATKLKLIDAIAAPGGVAHRDGKLGWTEILELGPTISATGKRGRDPGGFFLPPIQNTAFGRYLAAAIQISEVEVDTRLGRVRVLQSHVGMSVGHIYSPTLARSQAEGGVIQGIGYALYEERRLDPRHGTVLTGNLEDYRLCGLGDIGEIHVEFLPGGFENARGGGVGLGELCTLPVAAAIANAVYNATLWRPTQIPLRPDRVLAGVRS
jgi:xanthine dehydrogenase YagR molybdenum-binding subunit